MLWLPEADDPHGATVLLVLTVGRGRRSQVLWVLGPPFALLLRCFSCALTTAPFSAFSSLPFPPPKSIYEGSFGCGYLKERRASGLVFCENTASVYRALFVSSPGFLLVFSWRPRECVRELGHRPLGRSGAACPLLFLHGFRCRVCLFCACFVPCNSAVTNTGCHV